MPLIPVTANVAPAVQAFLDGLATGPVRATPARGWLISPQTLPGTTNIRMYPSSTPVGEVYTTVQDTGAGPEYIEVWRASTPGAFDEALTLNFASADPYSWEDVEVDCNAAGPAYYAVMRFQYRAPPAFVGGNPPGYAPFKAFKVESKRLGTTAVTGRMLRFQETLTPEKFLDFWMLGPDYFGPSVADEVHLLPLGAHLESLDVFLKEHVAASPFGACPGIDSPSGALQDWRFVQINYARTSLTQFPALV